MASPTVIASPHKRLLDRHTQKKLAGIGRVIMILLIMIIVVLPFYVAVLYSFRAPDAITAKIMEDGPTKGMTRSPLRWAMATTSAPGSATAGQPASEITPTGIPCSKGCR